MFTVPPDSSTVAVSAAATVPQDITVEVMIDRLELYRERAQIQAFGCFSEVNFEDIGVNTSSSIKLSNEEYAFILHTLEEKKMTNWMINGLQKEVSDLKSAVEREKQLHLNTLTHLEKTSSPALRTLLQEQSRLRQALHDSEFDQLKIENDFLKFQISQCTSGLLEAQNQIQSLRKPSETAEIGLKNAKSEAENLKNSLKSCEKKLEEKIEELRISRNNFEMLELEIEFLKNLENSKNFEISELQEQIRNLEETTNYDESYQKFIETDIKQKYGTEIEKLKRRIEELETEQHEKSGNSVEYGQNLTENGLEKGENEEFKPEQPKEIIRNEDLETEQRDDNDVLTKMCAEFFNFKPEQPQKPFILGPIKTEQPNEYDVVKKIWADFYNFKPEQPQKPLILGPIKTEQSEETVRNEDFKPEQLEKPEIPDKIKTEQPDENDSMKRMWAEFYNFKPEQPQKNIQNRDLETEQLKKSGISAETKSEQSKETTRKKVLKTEQLDDVVKQIWAEINSHKTEQPQQNVETRDLETEQLKKSGILVGTKSEQSKETTRKKVLKTEQLDDVVKQIWAEINSHKTEQPQQNVENRDLETEQSSVIQKRSLADYRSVLKEFGLTNLESLQPEIFGFKTEQPDELDGNEDSETEQSEECDISNEVNDEQPDESEDLETEQLDKMAEDEDSETEQRMSPEELDEIIGEMDRVMSRIYRQNAEDSRRRFRNRAKEESMSPEQVKECIEAYFLKAEQPISPEETAELTEKIFQFYYGELADIWKFEGRDPEKFPWKKFLSTEQQEPIEFLARFYLERGHSVADMLSMYLTKKGDFETEQPGKSDVLEKVETEQPQELAENDVLETEQPENYETSAQITNEQPQETAQNKVFKTEQPRTTAENQLFKTAQLENSEISAQIKTEQPQETAQNKVFKTEQPKTTAENQLFKTKQLEFSAISSQNNTEQPDFSSAIEILHDEIRKLKLENVELTNLLLRDKQNARDLRIQEKQETQRLSHMNLAEIEELKLQLDEVAQAKKEVARAKIEAAQAKEEVAQANLKYSMLVAQSNYDMKMMKDQLKSKTEQLENSQKGAESSEDSDGWKSVHGSDIEELETEEN